MLATISWKSKMETVKSSDHLTHFALSFLNQVFVHEEIKATGICLHDAFKVTKQQYVWTVWYGRLQSVNQHYVGSCDQ